MSENNKVELEYEERDGIFYPKIYTSSVTSANVGKYGHMWLRFMESEYPIRYRSLIRNEELYERTLQVEEIAWELHKDIEKNWLKKHKPKNSNSFVEIYKLRSEARMIAEEVVLQEVINCYH